MRLLLDECIDRRLAREISGHETETVSGMGWAGVKNGELLVLAAQHFDVFITVDSNIQFQSNVSALSLAVIVMRTKSNRLSDLRPLIPELLVAVDLARAGQIRLVGRGQT